MSRECSSRFTSGTRRVNLITKPVISHEWGKDREVFTRSGTYPWFFVRQIFHNGQSSHGGDRNTFEVMTYTTWLWHRWKFCIYPNKEIHILLSNTHNRKRIMLIEDYVIIYLIFLLAGGCSTNNALTATSSLQYLTSPGFPDEYDVYVCIYSFCYMLCIYFIAINQYPSGSWYYTCI